MFRGAFLTYKTMLNVKETNLQKSGERVGARKGEFLGEDRVLLWLHRALLYSCLLYCTIQNGFNIFFCTI